MCVQHLHAPRCLRCPRQRVTHPGGGEGGGVGGGHGGGGDGGGGDGGGDGGKYCREPQSAQSVPHGHELPTLEVPPSWQRLLLDHWQVLVQMVEALTLSVLKSMRASSGARAMWVWRVRRIPWASMGSQGTRMHREGRAHRAGSKEAHRLDRVQCAKTGAFPFSISYLVR